MASEIRANSITSRAGLSTVTMTDSGPMFSGITTFVDNSGFTFGVGGGTSIFTPATNILTLGTNNTEKVRIDANGNANITGVTTAANFKTGVSNLHNAGLTLSGGQLDVGSNIKVGTAGVITATSFVGSGANLTSLPAANLTGTLPAISGANLTNLPTATTITVADESSDTTCNPLFVTTTTGNLAPKTGTNLVFNSSSGNLRTGSLFLGTGSNESKTQDGLILERNSGDGEVHITAGRSGGNYGGMQFYVAGGSGVTKRFQIDYQSNFRWYDADGTTQRVRLDNVGRFQINQNSNITGTAKLEVMGTGDNTYPQYSFAIGVADTQAYNVSNGSGMGIGFSYKHNSSGSYALGCGIRGFKENTTDGNYAGAMAFYTRANGAGASEKLRIASDGSILTANNGTLFSWPSNPGHILYSSGEYRSTSANGTHIRCNRMNGDGHVAQWYRGQTNMVGYISINSSGTSYGSGSSDERTKKNIEVWNEDVLSKFKSLTPKKFNFNWEDDSVSKHKGYIAQNEVSNFPEAYPKNNLTDCDNEYHMFTPTDMTVYLMKGLKEAAEKIETLEQDNIALRARVTNLEGN